MRYVVYNTETSRIVTEKLYGKDTYATEAAAKAARTRLLKKPIRGIRNTMWQPEQLAVADIQVYKNCVEKMVEKVNLMSGKTYWESINTPNYCSPSSEAYWSM